MKREKVNLMYWQLTCRAFHTPQEWEWLFAQTGYDGDHINSVKGNWLWKGDPKNIRWLPNNKHPTLGNQHRYESVRGHNGNTRNPKGNGELIDRQSMIDRLKAGWLSGCGR